MCCLPSIDLTATGIRIMQLRERTGLSVQDLQDIFGFTTPQAIYKWQRGATLPSLDNLVALAAVFGTTMDAIIVRNGEYTGSEAHSA
ncbi:helix-turn-helix transcriptional regulator [Clostridiales bacterium]|nr:helix-turn-helix transcriptional regulator [Clostridiales bacterium]